MTRRPARIRPAVTLIEMLTVISIIGVLTALSVGAFVRVRSSQTVANSEGTLSKLHGLMNTRWGAVVDQAKKTVPQDLVVRCGGDKNRAEAVWTYATLKNEFPMTFAEATSNIDLGVRLQPRNIFAKVANDPAAAGLTPEEQSAALFYAAITQGGNAGNVADSDGTEPQTGSIKADGTGPRAYKDGWGNPIFFHRHAATDEINGTAYTKPRIVKAGGSSLTVYNMLDPQGLISDWTQTPSVGVNPWLSLKTLDPNPVVMSKLTNEAYLRQELAKGRIGIFAVPPAPPVSIIFAAQNTLPTLISAGANKTSGAAPFNITLDDSADNLLSYRLRREGDKGN